MATSVSESDAKALNETMRRWASSRLGPVEIVADRSRRVGRALVLEFEDRHGRRWILKRPKGLQSLQREVRAYRQFLAPLSVVAPRLEGVSRQHGALLSPRL